MTRTDEVWAELQRAVDENEQLRQQLAKAVTKQHIIEQAISLEGDGVFHLAHQALAGWADMLKKAGEEERLAEVLEAWEQLGNFSAWLSTQEERMKDEEENQ